jgi:hypothetical protein
MVDLKPLETRYKGYLFRSRLEARWAVFYDALDVRWYYEFEGFDLGDGIVYLPDFFLPDLNVWIEIKGMKPTPFEAGKAGWLARTTGQRVYIFFGDIPYPAGFFLECIPGSAWVFYEKGGWSDSQCWCECLVCGKVGIEFMGAGERICGEKCGGRRWHTAATPRLQAAYERARSARFEHGAQP